MEELDSVRALLPVWARSPGLLLGPVAFAIGFALSGLAARVALLGKGSFASGHWTERALAAHPARWVGSLMAFWAAVALAGLSAQRVGGLLSAPAWLVAVAAGVAAYLGGMSALAGVEARVGLPARSRIRFALGRVGMLCVVCPHLLVLAALACVVDGGPGAGNAAAAALGISAFALLAIWGGLPLARAFGAARPASEKLRGAVDRAVAKTGIVARSVYEIDLPMSNAFALPLPQWLVFTRRCVAELSECELEAVVCHELGHLSEPTSVKAARVGASFAILPMGFAPAFIDAFGWLTGLAVVYASVLGVSIPMLRLSRRMEARADAVAGRHEADAGIYAVALERLHELNLVPAIGWSGGGSHPHLYDRMEAAGVVPAYPRPRPPSRVRALLGTIAGLAALTLSYALAGGSAVTSERRAAADVALFGGSAEDFFQLAAYGERRSPQDAEAFLRAALALRPMHHAAYALLAEKLVAMRRCDEAWTAYAEAEHLLEGQDHADECPWVIRSAEAMADCE